MSFTISKRFKQPSFSLGQNLSLGSLEDDYHNLGEVCMNNPLSYNMLVGQPQVTFFHLSVGWGWMLQTPCSHFSSQTMSWKEFQVVECLGVFITFQRPPVIWCTHQACRCIIVSTISMRCVLTCISKHKLFEWKVWRVWFTVAALWEILVQQHPTTDALEIKQAKFQNSNYRDGNKKHLQSFLNS
jgi:hypothetical protein